VKGSLPWELVEGIVSLAHAALLRYEEFEADPAFQSYLHAHSNQQRMPIYNTRSLQTNDCELEFADFKSLCGVAGKKHNNTTPQQARASIGKLVRRDQVRMEINLICLF